MGPLRLCSLAENLGAVETLVTHPASMTHASLTPQERAAGAGLISKPNIDGAIAFERVGFAYDSGSPPVLDAVDLRIAAGERVGIVGRVGQSWLFA
mgnify:CR=1 FL=1